MELDQKESLRRHRVAITDDLEPKEVLDYLNQDGVLTDNDCELVSTGKTRKVRCQLLLSLLPRRGPSAYGAFTRALGDARYEHIQQLLMPADDSGEIGSGTEAFSTEIKELVETCSTERKEFEDACSTRKKEISDSGDETLRKNVLTNAMSDESQPKRLASTTENARNDAEHNPCTKCRNLLIGVSGNKQLSSLLHRHCCLFFDNVEPIDLIDHHFQEGVLSDDECERVRAGATRKDRCETLFKELAKRPAANGVLSTLKKSLEKKYNFILDRIDDDIHGQLTEVPGDLSPSRKQEVRQKRHENVFHDDNSLTTVDGAKVYVEKSASKSCQKQESPHPKKIPKCQNRVATPKVSSDTDSDGYLQIATRKRQQRRRKTRQRDEQHGDVVVIHHSPKTLFTTKPSSTFTESAACKRLSVAFNYLSTLINQGCYEEFESVSANLQNQYVHEPDMTCLLSYLHASRDLFKNDFDAAKRHIDLAFETVPKTSDPKYFTVELFTAKTRMYVTQKRLEKLENALDDVKQIIETDPTGCTGRAAGWLYMNDGRSKTSQMTTLNPYNRNYLTNYSQLHAMAKESFQRALENFQRDGGKDGPLGSGYAICRLCILLLKCGDNGLTMNTLHPSEDDVKTAGGYIRQLEDSSIPIPKILEVHLLLGKCDYQFRRGNIVRALEHAEAALSLATQLNMLEFTEHARNRVVFLKTETPLQLKEVTDEKDLAVLFEKNSETAEETDGITSA
ncbi:uncharacterized protein LOC106159007 isoform X2 [Lingula anatina]|nr:uncharacterized protein LOC106159007 isoform X2 [Lingula anatina]XP_013390635.1 uncharacterized protein LOC106159007 isoform X2 [Lingula anatina]|eukprot:XP_013390627.1 uncharacterized protein LOC106159007 isoform X2 [Lingula anatina]